MKFFASILFLILQFILVSFQLSYSYTIGYNDSEDRILIWNSATNKITKTNVKSYDFCFSPNGDEICAVIETKKDKKASERYLVIYKIKSGTSNELKIPRTQCYGPLWSACGNYILFMYLPKGIISRDWSVALYNLKNNSFKIFNLKNHYLCSWVDTKSFLVHDFRYIKRISLGGVVLMTLDTNDQNNFQKKDSKIISLIHSNIQQIYYNPSENIFFFLSPMKIDSKCLAENLDWFMSILKYDANKKIIKKLSPLSINISSIAPSPSFAKFIVSGRDTNCTYGVWLMQNNTIKKLEQIKIFKPCGIRTANFR
jgi:hypothetical protein